MQEYHGKHWQNSHFRYNIAMHVFITPVVMEMLNTSHISFMARYYVYKEVVKDLEAITQQVVEIFIK